MSSSSSNFVATSSLGYNPQNPSKNQKNDARGNFRNMIDVLNMGKKIHFGQIYPNSASQLNSDPFICITDGNHYVLRDVNKKIPDIEANCSENGFTQSWLQTRASVWANLNQRQGPISTPSLQPNVNSNAPPLNTNQIIVNMVDNFAIDDNIMDTLFSEFQYTGLNTDLIFKTMLIEAHEEINELLSDVTAILVFIATRGVRPDRRRVMSTMSREGFDRINGLIAKYTILVNAVPTNSDDITFARIVATFPNLFSTLLHKYQNNGIIRFPGDNESVVCPTPLKFPNAPALIPKNSNFNYLFNDWCTFVDDFGRTINRRTARDNVNDGKTHGLQRTIQINYGHIIRESGKLTDAQREEFLKNVGIKRDVTRENEALLTSPGNVEPEIKNVIVERQ